MTQHGTAGRPTSPHRYRWLQWFAVADPGDTLLVNAFIATLAVAASVGAVVVLTHRFAGGQRPTTLSTVVFALVGSLLSMILVSDATIKDRRSPRFSSSSPWPVRPWSPRSPPRFGGWAASCCSPSSSWPTTCAVSGRGSPLGLAAILSFLIMLSTHAEAAQRPWLVITAGVVTGFAYLFRFVIPHPVRRASCVKASRRSPSVP